jgi:GT2 family glycosyltransferase
MTDEAIIYRGAVDGLDNGAVVGWCAENPNVGNPVVVSIYDFDRLVGTAPADRFRADLTFDGLTGSHAYVFDLPAEVYDGRDHLFSVTVGAPPQKMGTLSVIQLIDPETAYVGEVESLVARQVTGWVSNPEKRSRSHEVYVIQDGAVIANGTATGGEAARFAVALPDFLFDGSRQQISVMVGDQRIEISGSPLFVQTRLVTDDVEMASFRGTLNNSHLQLGLIGDQLGEISSRNQQAIYFNRIASEAVSEMQSVLARLERKVAEIADVVERLTPTDVLLPDELVYTLSETADELARLTPELARFDDFGPGLKQVTLLERVRLRFPPLVFDPTDPLVSIVIPVYNQFFYTHQCLVSLLRNLSDCSFEVILVDDCSTDETYLAPELLQGVKILRNVENLGFVGSCNRGAAEASGKYVFFLNNDTTLNPGAIDALVDTFANFPKAGLVGSKLVYPDGRLQEAGGILWQDGSGWNYGRLADADHSDYNYVRSVDYVSGAAIMLPKTLWDELGGFDVRYKPAYYEDADLAMQVRHAGYDVLYQPSSVVVHFEGISNGRDVKSGMKAYQVRNMTRFQDKWASVLAGHRPNALEPLLERDRGVTKRMLLIDAVTPEPDKDAGSVVTFEQMKILQGMGFKITFIPEDNFAHMAEYTPPLQALGIECIYHPFFSTMEQFLSARGAEFDVIYIHRFGVTEKCLTLLRQYAPNAPIVFNTQDLHYLRMERAAKLRHSAFDLVEASKVKTRELEVIKAADCTIVLSSVEKALLEQDAPGAFVYYFPWVQRPAPRGRPGFAERQGFMFIGGYGHHPNVDAIDFFICDVMPIVREMLPGVRFYIYGSKMPDSIKRLASSDVIIGGFVPDLEPVFDRHRLSVAPLRYGAGFKGKVVTSLSYSVPAVLTSVAAEGMGVTDGEQVLIGDDGRSFAEALVRLYTDQALWERMSDAGWNFVNESFSPAQGEKRFNEIFRQIGRENLASDAPPPAPPLPAADKAGAVKGRRRK